MLSVLTSIPHPQVDKVVPNSPTSAFSFSPTKPRCSGLGCDPGCGVVVVAQCLCDDGAGACRTSWRGAAVRPARARMPRSRTSSVRVLTRAWLVIERLSALCTRAEPVEGLWSSLEDVELVSLTGPSRPR